MQLNSSVGVGDLYFSPGDFPWTEIYHIIQNQQAHSHQKYAERNPIMHSSDQKVPHIKFNTNFR